MTTALAPRIMCLVCTPLVRVRAVLLVALCILLVPASPAHAAAYVVTSTGDSGTGSGTSGDLRYVVAQANAHPGSTITFATATNGQVITLGSTITITADVTITGNGATNTAIAMSGASALLTVQGSAALTLSGVTLSGGLEKLRTTSSGTVSVTDSVFTGGQTGIYMRNSGTLTVNRSLFSNISEDGIDRQVAAGPTTVTNSTFTGGNSAVYDQVNTPFVIAGSTISDASVALYRQYGSLTLTNSILSGSGTSVNCEGTINDGGHNLAYDFQSADTSCTFTDPTSHQDRNPLLDTFVAANGTSNGIQTFALLPGSPAINSGTCAYTDAGGTARTLATDGRNVNRPQGSVCDIGSFESRGFTTGSPTGNNQSAGVNTAFGSPVGLTVSSANTEPVQGGSVTFTITAGGGGASATIAGGSTVAARDIGAGWRGWHRHQPHVYRERHSRRLHDHGGSSGHRSRHRLHRDELPPCPAHPRGEPRGG